VLPRVRITTGDNQRKMVSVGKAQFWPDEDDIWDEVVRKARPRWLDIFRDWPHPTPEGTEPAEPQVARGTLLISDDDDWLAQHVHSVIPLVYVLGLPQADWARRPPAEAFHYGGFRATDRSEENVTFATKTGDLIMECATSLKLFPPLELRGDRRYFLVDIGDDSDQKVRRLFGGPPSGRALNGELVRRFEGNPRDRIVMACYHLFRSQFANEFMSPVPQDYAAYCASLEASLDIDGTQRDVAARITQRLVELYPDLAGLDVWTKGLYAERSSFVHGASHKPKYEREIAEFRKRKHNADFLARLCLDVIHDALRESLDRQGRDSARLQGEGYAGLRKVFSSDDYWAAMSHHFKQRKCVDRILAYSSEERTAFLRACQNFAGYHDWRYMERPPTRHAVLNVLVAAAYTICKAGGGSVEDRASALQVGTAAKNDDDAGIRAWLQQHYRWIRARSGDDLVNHVKRVVAQMAAFVEPTIQDFWAH
jgi:hypothetical protein